MMVIDLEIDVIWSVWSTQPAQVSSDHNNTAEWPGLVWPLRYQLHTALLNIIQFIIWAGVY